MSFSKESLTFLRDLKDEYNNPLEDTDLEHTQKPMILRRRSKTTGAIVPGKTFIFNYENPREHSTVVLIVKNYRTDTGIFISTLHNHLLSCFKIDESDATTVALIMDNLYKNDNVSYQNIISSLEVLLGSDEYRTYDLNFITNFTEIDIS